MFKASVDRFRLKGEGWRLVAAYIGNDMWPMALLRFDRGDDFIYARFDTVKDMLVDAPPGSIKIEGETAKRLGAWLRTGDHDERVSDLPVPPRAQASH